MVNILQKERENITQNDYFKLLYSFNQETLPFLRHNNKDIPQRLLKKIILNIKY